MSYRKPAPSLELSYFSTTLLKKNEEGLNKELTTIKVCKSIHCHLSCLLEIWLGHEITLKESPTADLIVLLSFGPGFNQNTLERWIWVFFWKQSSLVAPFPQSPQPWPWTRWQRWSQPCWCARTGSPQASACPPASYPLCSPDFIKGFRINHVQHCNAHQVPYEGDGWEDNGLVRGDTHILQTRHLEHTFGLNK